MRIHMVRDEDICRENKDCWQRYRGTILALVNRPASDANECADAVEGVGSWPLDA